MAQPPSKRLVTEAAQTAYMFQYDSTIPGKVAAALQEPGPSGQIATQVNAALAAAEGGRVVNPQALRPWLKALAEQHQTPARVVVVGDSISEGTWAGRFQGTWPSRLQTLLRGTREPQDRGIGYVASTPTDNAVVPPPLNTRVGGTMMGGWGIGGRCIHLHDASHHVTYQPQVCTKVRVWYGKTDFLPGGLKVFIDGTQVATLSSSRPEGNLGGFFWDSATLSDGPHVVRLEAQNTNGTVGILEGVEFIRGEDAGIRVYNAAHFGYTTASFLTGNMNVGHWSQVTAIGPDLGIIMLGANDLYTDVPAATYLANITSIIGKFAAGVPILLVNTYLRGDALSKAALWESYRTGLAAKATGRVAYLDLAPKWPALEPGGGTLLMSDGAHPTDAGMERLAAIIGDGITDPRAWED